MPHDHDQIFKGLIKEFFREFMELFLPEEAKEIDFRKVEFLEKEYFTDIHGGRRKELDLVVKVRLKGGEEEYILVHVEFQATKEKEFPRRMYEYYSQLYLRYRKPIIPVAVFADDAVWREPIPNTYTVGFKGKEYIRFQYQQIKLKNYSYRDFLEKENPLAYALMAKMGYDKSKRVRLKADFLRWILRAKVNKARGSILIEFVESYMELNRIEEKTFENLIHKEKEYKEVQKMVTVYEKRGIEKGIEQGIERGIEQGIEKGIEQGIEKGVLEGKQDALILVIESRFGRIGSTLEEKIRHISSIERLNKLMKQASVIEDSKNLKI